VLSIVLDLHDEDDPVVAHAPEGSQTAPPVVQHGEQLAQIAPRELHVNPVLDDGGPHELSLPVMEPDSNLDAGIGPPKPPDFREAGQSDPGDGVRLRAVCAVTSSD
jgi:hypothetical protein